MTGNPPPPTPGATMGPMTDTTPERPAWLAPGRHAVVHRPRAGRANRYTEVTVERLTRTQAVIAWGWRFDTRTGPPYRQVGAGVTPSYLIAPDDEIMLATLAVDAARDARQTAAKEAWPAVDAWVRTGNPADRQRALAALMAAANLDAEQAPGQ